MKIRISYDAEGRINRCKCTLTDICDNIYDDFHIDYFAWTRTKQEK